MDRIILQNLPESFKTVKEQLFFLNYREMFIKGELDFSYDKSQ